MKFCRYFGLLLQLKDRKADKQNMNYKKGQFIRASEVGEYVFAPAHGAYGSMVIFHV
jgi:hypothetical protein